MDDIVTVKDSSATGAIVVEMAEVENFIRGCLNLRTQGQRLINPGYDRGAADNDNDRVKGEAYLKAANDGLQAFHQMCPAEIREFRGLSELRCGSSTQTVPKQLPEHYKDAIIARIERVRDQVTLPAVTSFNNAATYHDVHPLQLEQLTFGFLTESQKWEIIEQYAEEMVYQMTAPLYGRLDVTKCLQDVHIGDYLRFVASQHVHNSYHKVSAARINNFHMLSTDSTELCQIWSQHFAYMETDGATANKDAYESAEGDYEETCPNRRRVQVRTPSK